MRWMTIVLALVTTTGTACLSSRCLRDIDCAGSLVCREEAGQCVEPQCSTNDQCGAGEVCEERFCVGGCESPEDCATDERCVNRRCLKVGGRCDCPLAHEFCGTDLNPNSATAGTEVCVAGDFPEGVGLFFGSVYCGHCTSDWAALQTVRAGLAADGLSPRMVWVQLTTATATPEEVAARLGPDVTDPVIHDTTDLRIWEAYGATWYHFLLVDADGCFVSDHGPLDPSSLAGEEGVQIADEWRGAMDDVCPNPTP